MRFPNSNFRSLFQGLHIKPLLFLFAVMFIVSCAKEDKHVLNDDVEVSGRAMSNCDGTPMFPPTILDAWTEDGLCCFEIQFSVVYLDGSTVQIIGFDASGNTMVLQPNGYCLDDMMMHKFTCCINDAAATITISLFPSNRCIEIPLPCN